MGRSRRSRISSRRDRADLAQTRLGRTHCEVCGDKLTLTEEICEMYKPPDDRTTGEPKFEPHFIGHVIHLQEGYELA